LVDETDFTIHKKSVLLTSQIIGATDMEYNGEIIEVSCIEEHMKYFRKLCEKCLLDIQKRNKLSDMFDALKTTTSDVIMQSLPILREKLAVAEKKLAKQKSEEERNTTIKHMFQAQKVSAFLVSEIGKYSR
jgi:predicted GTPase